MNEEAIDHIGNNQRGDEARDPSNIVTYKHFVVTDTPQATGAHRPRMPTLNQLLSATFKQRKYLLAPWLREQENCMVYAATGVGKSLFAMSAALAVAGNGEFLGWRPEGKSDGGNWRVLYVDGEMHIADIQERARQLRCGLPKLDKAAVDKNLYFLARQHQDAGVQFPSITEQAGQSFILDRLMKQRVDLVVLDNFSTLGEVEDENAASSFNAIQQFLLQLKVQEWRQCSSITLGRPRTTSGALANSRLLSRPSFNLNAHRR
jgi:RecA-family ATPase